jgi:DNA-directed RNA polymerase specialized sigma subunit
MTDTKKILDYILASHSPVISGTINKMREKYPHLKEQDHGDLYESAVNAAMSAIHGHDPDRGAKLSTYMSQKIANSLLQRFQPKDVSAADRALASRTRSSQPSNLDSVQSTAPSVSRGEIESAGGSVSDEGGASGVSIIRNTAADFAARNPHIRAELERKTQKYEAQQAKKQPVVQEAPTPQPEAPKPKPEQPKMIIRRKQVEASLQPEHLDRMKRIDGKKVN